MGLIVWIKGLMKTSGFYSTGESGEDLKLNEGLGTYYPLNGDAEDKIGNKDGSIEGPITSKDKYGRNEHSLSFDGVDDSIFINQRNKKRKNLDYLKII